MRSTTRLVVGTGMLVVLGFVGYAFADDPADASPPRARAATEATEGPDPISPPLALFEVGRGAVDHRPGDHSATGSEGGEVPNRATPLDTHLPGIAHLDPQLLAAVQQAARDAGEDGVPFFVTSGWRSRAYQQQLLDEATAHYASEDVARQFVATPDTSSHVTGEAVDIGPTDADSWLSQHGARYGLCQTYANEMWHFELATEPGGICPRMLPDASGLE